MASSKVLGFNVAGQSGKVPVRRVIRDLKAEQFSQPFDSASDPSQPDASPPLKKVVIQLSTMLVAKGAAVTGVLQEPIRKAGDDRPATLAATIHSKARSSVPAENGNLLICLEPRDCDPDKARRRSGDPIPV